MSDSPATEAGGSEQPAPERRLSVLLVRVAERRYAIESGYVNRIVEEFDVHPIPRTPPALTGATNVDGEVAAAVDLAAVLGTAGTAPRATGPLVHLHRPDGDGVGFVVDGIEDVTAVDVSRIAPVDRDAGPDADRSADDPTPAIVEVESGTDPSGEGARGRDTATGAAGSDADDGVRRWLRGRITAEEGPAAEPVGLLDVPYLLQTVANDVDSRNP